MTTIPLYPDQSDVFLSVVTEPAEKDLLTPAEQMLAEARDLVIDGPAMAETAASELRRIMAKHAELAEERFSMTRPLDESKARIIEKYRQPLFMLEQARDFIKTHVLTYNRKVEDERRRAQIEADRVAREARVKLEREAAAAKAKADAEANELRERAAAAAAEGRAADAAKLEARAEHKVEAADAKADVLFQAAMAVPTSVALPAAHKPKGVFGTTRYSAECTDKAALLAFVHANPMYLNLLAVDQTALNAQAKALKEQFQIPGCKLVKNETATVRG